MDTVRIDRKNVKIIAHRGLSGIERENTCAAFVAAANRSYFGVETDVRKTADGKLALMHDDNIGRVSENKYDLKVAANNFSTLHSVALPDLDGTGERTDLRIPLLSDYVNICKKYDKICVLEIKQCFADEELKEIVDEIEALDYIKNTIFISFSLDYCVTIRRMLPTVRIQWLADREATPEIINTLVLNHIDLDVYYPKLTEELVKEIHSLGLEVNCWTCDKADDAQKLIKMGVDYITTNILE